MQEAIANTQEAEQKRFEALLTPHRSLPPRGFVVLMIAVGVVSFVMGVAFLVIGAWPVMGFFGLDAALIYAAFRLNYRSARMYETVEIDEDELVLTRVAPSGKSESWRFNTYWARIAVSERTGRTSELSVSSHGKRLVFGSFLTDAERLELATALRNALQAGR